MRSGRIGRSRPSPAHRVWVVLLAVSSVLLVLIAELGRTVRAQSVPAQPGATLPETAERQIKVLLDQKAQRTPAQRKLSSHLLDMLESQPPQASEGGGHRRPPAEPVLVDIRADVTPAVLARIRALGGTVINSVPTYRAIRARLPLHAMERLAALAAVQTIRPADEARTHPDTPDTAEGMDAR